MNDDMIEYISDILVDDHVSILLENSKLREKVKKLQEEIKELKRVPIGEDKLWEMWNADDHEDSPEWFASFKHTARWIERVHGIKEDE